MIDTRALLDECMPAIAASGYDSGYYQRCVERIRDTLPKILKDSCASEPRGLCMRKKHYGIWNSFTNAQVFENIKYMSLGLKHLGLRRGDKVCIIGDNDPEWYWAEIAVQAMGAAVVGLYIDAMPSDLQYLVNDSDSVFVISKDQEQTDKFLEIKAHIPNVQQVIYWDNQGMVRYKDNPWLLENKALIQLGKQFEKENPGFFDEAIEAGTDNDIAVICYTSGTTGLPKGVMLSHAYLIKGSIRWGAVAPPSPGDNYLSYVPPAWISEQLMIAGWVVYKTQVNFPEAPETVMANLREIGARTCLLSPMQWQGILSQVQMKILDTGRIRRMLYNLSVPVGYKYSEYAQTHGRRPPLYLRLLYWTANGLVLRHIRDYLGLSKLRYALTGGSALGPDVIRWYKAIGVKIRDAYGLTEINPAVTHRDMIKPGTSGVPVPGVEVKITDQGEILLRADVHFSGYYKKPEETRKMFLDGWVRTGDAGTIDPDGHLIVYDRMKEMLSLKDGTRYSPTYIQNRLKFSPYIKEVLVVGGSERPFLFALITIDFDNVGKWAEKNHISYTTFVDLSQRPQVYDLIEKDVIRVNATLPENARVQRFTLLHKEFDADEGELTKTRKLRRAFLENRYTDLIEAAFGGRDRIDIEAEVKYRDGRTGTVRTDLKIKTTDTGE
jgi:long-chain acyl-CoA synthetase